MAALTTACGDDVKGSASDGSTSDAPTTSASTGSTGDGTTDGTGTPTTTMTGKQDMGVAPVMCNPSLQDCPEGQKCTAYQSEAEDGWQANRCVPEPMNGGGVGDPCQIDEGESVFSGLDNCAAGNFCFNFDFATGQGGACIEFCKQDDSCPDTNGGNAGCVQGANMGVLPICLAKCDPLTQDCPDGQACYGDVSLPFFVCATPDPPEMGGGDNAPCEYTNACEAGLNCTAAEAVEGCDPNAMACCAPFCSVAGGNGQCAPTEECVAFYADPPPGLEDVGICAIPQ